MNLFVIISILAAVGVSMAFPQFPHRRNKNVRCRLGDGSSYRGNVAKSSNGRRCLRWSSVFHLWGDSDGIDTHNFCRNPDHSLKPWCYIYKRRQIMREYCDIPRCHKPEVKSTTTPTTTPTTSSPPAVDTERTCGERTEHRQNKIVGGSFTPIESHPWVAALYLNRRIFLCGGSLISPGWVLTAAHCFFDGDKTKLQHLSVYLGRTAINETDAAREQRFTVEQLIIHEDYKESNYNNDIALLKIKSSNGGWAVKTPSVRTICLPPLHTQLPAGFKCSIAGFGRQSFDSEYSQLLKQADVNLLSSKECKRKPLYSQLFTDNMICAASPDWKTDACKGDSGGPLVCEASGRMFLFGVVSWGDGCAAVNKPGVYAKVTNYNKWIAAKTGLAKYTAGVMYPQK